MSDQAIGDKPQPTTEEPELSPSGAEAFNPDEPGPILPDLDRSEGCR